MAYRANCPHCGDAFSCREEDLGKSVRCPKCQAAIAIRDRPPEKNKRLELVREIQAGGVSVRALVAAIAAALVIGVACAGGAAYLYLRPGAAQAITDPPPGPQASAPEGPAPSPSPPVPAAEQAELVGEPDTPAPPNQQDRQPLQPKDHPKPTGRAKTAKVENHPLEDGEKGLHLPGIGGWLLAPDGITLIVALPAQAKLIYIDTLAHKELKRVAISFKPDRLAVQGKHLVVSVQGSNTLHILDLDSGADKKEVEFQGAITDMVCHPRKGPVFVAASQGRISAMDPAAGQRSNRRPRRDIFGDGPFRGWRRSPSGAGSDHRRQALCGT
jgi:DNA-directed RNA polymerase subunit RPC12/RpoP